MAIFWPMFFFLRGKGLSFVYVWITYSIPRDQEPTTLEKFENGALVQLGVLSKLIRHENGDFQKRFSNCRNLKTTALSSSLVGKHFENGASQNR